MQRRVARFVARFLCLQRACGGKWGLRGFPSIIIWKYIFVLVYIAADFVQHVKNDGDCRVDHFWHFSSVILLSRCDDSLTVSVAHAAVGAACATASTAGYQAKHASIRFYILIHWYRFV